MSPSAIIIGSGPGGATAAEVLTRAGWSVVIMEKGRNHLLDPDDLTKPAGDYSNDEIKFVSRYFLGPDPLVEPRAFRLSADDGEHTHVGEVNSIPTTVGGGGTHADGKVPRFREEDFGMFSTYGPQEGAAVDDWPLDYDELELRGAHRGQQHRLRRPARLQQLRLLRLLRLPDPRQGRSGGAAHQGDGHGPGRADGRNLREPDHHPGSPGHRGGVHRS
jgi:choline dehydrogenase-like flavoprotein